MIAVVSHDAGGAEILSSLIRRAGLRCIFALDGPARDIFARKLGAAALGEPVPLEQAIDRAEWVLCGTSWQSDLEWRAFGLARATGKRSVAFLDHWINYRERFERGGAASLPDEIWTGDEDAFRIASDLFAGTLVRRVANPYVADIEEELRAAEARCPRRADGSVRILYVAEALAEHHRLRFGNERHFGYTEFDALEFLLAHADAIAPNALVVIRPHPADPAGKYTTVAEAHAPRVVLGGGRSLAEEIAASDVVAGCNSMAMVVGLLARKRVVCCIPPGGQPCRLPQKQIESLQALAGAGAPERVR